MADGERDAISRGEMYAVRDGLQRQIDAVERALENRFRDVRDEIRKLTDAVTAKTNTPDAASLALHRAIDFAENLKNKPAKAGTPAWVYFIIVVLGLLGAAALHKQGLI